MKAKTLNIRSFVAKTHLSRFTLVFSDNKCPLFARLGEGPKGDNVTFFYRFFYCGASLRHLVCFGMLPQAICLELKLQSFIKDTLVASNTFGQES